MHGVLGLRSLRMQLCSSDAHQNAAPVSRDCRKPRDSIPNHLWKVRQGGGSPVPGDSGENGTSRGPWPLTRSRPPLLAKREPPSEQDLNQEPNPAGRNPGLGRVSALRIRRQRSWNGVQVAREGAVTTDVPAGLPACRPDAPRCHAVWRASWPLNASPCLRRPSAR
jgi:hypothetical protein